MMMAAAANGVAHHDLNLARHRDTKSSMRRDASCSEGSIEMGKLTMNLFASSLLGRAFTAAGVGAVASGDRLSARIEGLSPLDITVGPPSA